MDFVYNCQDFGCNKKAIYLCPNDSLHRYCENCIKMHRKKHRCEIILIQEFKNQYIEFLPIVFDRLDNFKLKIIECSIKLIKYVKDCTSDALKELHNHRVAIIKKINGLSDLNDIKKYTDDIKFHVSDQKYFDDINKETKRFFEIQFVFIK